MRQSPPRSEHRSRSGSQPRFRGLFLLGLAAALSSLLSLSPAKVGSPSGFSDAARLNNLGVAYMDRQESAEALKAFEHAYSEDPSLYVARVNQGIALLNLQRADEAKRVFDEATQKEPENPRPWYNLGLLYKSQGDTADGIAAFARVARIDPNDSDTFFFLGLLYSQNQSYPQAIENLRHAIALNPFHVSAEFALAQAYQRSGNAQQAKVHLARFQHMNEAKLGKPMSLVYGEQGKYSLAEQVTAALTPTAPPIPVRFADVTAEAGLPAGSARAAVNELALGSGACVFDFDGDGKPDIFLPNADGTGRIALLHGVGNGKFVDVTASSGLTIDDVVNESKLKGETFKQFPAGESCAAADYDNDGRTDLAIAVELRISSPSAPGGAPFQTVVKLFHNEGQGRFRAVQIPERTYVGNCGGLTFFDFDHDGDLDLYINCGTFRAGQPSAISDEPDNYGLLLRNNGNGTFTAWDTPALTMPHSGFSALASDINNDRAVDLVVAGDANSPIIFFNQREGPFEETEPWTWNLPMPTVGIAALDFDKDGWMDLAFTHPDEHGITLWRNRDGLHFDPVALPKLGWARAWGVAALDYDNDGWVDLVAVGDDSAGAGRIALIRNEGEAGFADVTQETGLDKIKLKHPRAVIPFDYNGDGATDLLITQAGGPPVLLRNIGANKNHSMHLTFKGVADSKTGFGAKIDVYAGAMRQKFEYTGPAAFLGQSDAGITVGLGNETKADIVRLLWPTGVLQDELAIAAGSNQQITELDRRGSSCPIVFVWNGSKYEFLSDVVGPGIVGHWIAPNQRNIPDPTEYIKVDGSQVRLRNGRISFKLLEPMEELDYLDQVRLLAIDHPGDAEVYPNERFLSNPPFPEFKVIASRHAHLPAGAWDGHGNDVLPLLEDRDRKYVTDFPLEPFAGFAKMHTLELDLGPWDASKPLRLLMDGFTDYFSASSMYAAWQAGLSPIPPYVEALDSSGKWVRVIDDMGFPAGLARTMVADLTGRVPAGTRRIRIKTNLKVYWDRIRIDNSGPEIPVHVTEIPLASANLEFRGYPRVIDGAPETFNDIRYVYEDVSATGPYTRQIGNYTRYGDVRELINRVDNEYVIFGSGDQVSADFDPSHLPPLPTGWTRDYFFYADGFAKDMDFYAAHGDTVAPLPFHSLVPYPYPEGLAYPMDAEHQKYLLDYNTRPVSGPPGNSFQFHYHAGSP